MPSSPTGNACAGSNGCEAAGSSARATLDTIYAPVRSQTAFEETLERLGTAIKLGLLAPAHSLPAERELCTRLGCRGRRLRQALTAFVQSGHLHAVRGRGGGTFVSDRPPPGRPTVARAAGPLA